MKKSLVCAVLAVAYMTLGAAYIWESNRIFGIVCMTLGAACVALAVADAYSAGRGKTLDALEKDYETVRASWERALAAQDKAGVVLLDALRILDALEQGLGEVCAEAAERADGSVEEERPL